MEIEIDYNPTPSTSFFISVSLNKTEAISFDCTTKAHNIKKQVLISKKPFPTDKPITSEWDALIIKDRRFIKKYHVRWIDIKKRDWCNDEIWETTEIKPMSKKLTGELLYYSRLISDNYKTLPKFSDKLKIFEQILSKEVSKFLN